MAFEIALAQAEIRKTRKSSYGWQGPPTVTIVHKSNVLSVTDGLFRESVRAVAKDFPGVVVEEQIVDSLVYKLRLKPFLRRLQIYFSHFPFLPLQIVPGTRKA